MKPLNQPFHHISKVFFIFSTQHANQINNFLNQFWKLKVDVLNQGNENILVVINKICVEIFE